MTLPTISSHLAVKIFCNFSSDYKFLDFDTENIKDLLREKDEGYQNKIMVK